MEEMKSALEKALERAEGLGKLSPEEMEANRQEEYAPIGRSLADRYLGHGYGQILRDELNKYNGQQGDIVTRAALSRLVEAIELGKEEASRRAIEGILALGRGQGVTEMSQRITDLLKEFERAEEEKFEQEKEEVERRGRELLHRLRISGSAIGRINLEASEAWQELSRELYSQFDERLQALKSKLQAALSEQE